ncbi:prolipoprotein diacylglyceryl transferase [Rothia sp. P5766]|uniref:prolipoprotein diacylglyceryl transferase n=1 Tax=Rothia sp. P5766 TaxID=3402656 RepID=UPI003AD835A2
MNDSTLLASIPSPSISTIELGPLTIHYYALCILAGIMLCLWLTSRRWQAWGEDPERVWDIALWAIPLGIVGARAYHVLITDPGTYFGPGADPLDVFKIWEGGIGIMGAISVGGLGAWLACHRYGISLAKFADAAAPGIMLAQAMGRWGNWFNQELFGKPTTLPWGLEISASSPNFPSQYPVGTLFHPTFLYESLWNILGATLLLYLGKKGFFQRGQTFWAYVVWYGFGRLMIEAFLRIDTAEMLWGMRIHVWTSGAIMLLGLAMFILMGWRSRRRSEFTDAGKSAPPSVGSGD